MTACQSILVVDDDEVLRYSMSKALRRSGYELFEAANMQQAQEVLISQTRTAEPIDWVVLDLRLGETSGLALAQWMLKHDAQLQIVMLTGYASVSTAVEAIKLGVKDYLIKPVGVEEIIQAFNAQAIDVDQSINAQPLSPKRLEWEHIQKVLLTHDGNISAAARALKMHRRTLQRKLQKKPVRD